MSHIAFDLDALPLVPKVARSAGIGEAVVGWGLTQMWEWCWREKTDRVTTNHLRGFFGSEIGAILVDFGFLEAAGSSLWRVRGAARYLRIQAARELGGKKAAAAGNLKRGRAAPAGAAAGASPQLVSSSSPADPQLTSQLPPRPTATSDERLATSDKHLESTGEKPPVEAAKSKPVDPRHAPMRTALIEAFRRKRGIEYPFDYGREDAEIRRLLKLGLEPTVLAAWERALDSSYPTISTLAKFRMEFPRFVGRGEGATKTPKGAQLTGLEGSGPLTSTEGSL